jgi:2-hydroxymuconate-semialdehyde hydrolase
MDFIDHSITVEGCRAHYIEGGRGFPLLLIHGSGPGASTLGNWRRVLEPLARGYHVYAMDLVGFGRSDRKQTEPYFDVALWMKQCQALIERMPGKEIGVIGHSLSGALALKLAAREARIAAVMTTATMGAPFALNPAVEKTWTFPATRAALREAAYVLVHDKSLVDAAYLDARVQTLHHDPHYGAYFTSMFAGDRQNYIDQTVLSAAELANIRCKVLMLHGREDVGFPPALSLELAGRIPQADVSFLGECSHSIAFEYPEKFLAAAHGLFPAGQAAANEGRIP